MPNFQDMIVDLNTTQSRCANIINAAASRWQLQPRTKRPPVYARVCTILDNVLTPSTPTQTTKV